MNRSQIEKMLMASGGITGEPVLSAKFGSYAGSTGSGRGGPAGMTTTERKRQAPVVKSNTADRQLNNLVIKSRNDERYRNEQGAGMNYGTAYDLAPKKAKDFVDRQLAKTGGRLNEAAKARLNSYLTDRTQYQLDLDKFRKSSPANEAAYVKRFPKTAAFERILRQGAEGIVGTPGKIIKKLTDTYLDGVKNMVEKISGVDAKNVEIAKDKNTDINTVVNNLQRKVKEERDDGKARGMSEADLTAMYGDPIDVETGDDIFGGDLLGMDLLEDDSPLRTDNVPGTNVPPEDRVPTPIRETRTETPGDNVPGTYVPPEDRVPGLDLTAPSDSVDLSGAGGRDDAVATAEQEFQDTYGFDSANYQAALDSEKKQIAADEAAGNYVFDHDRTTPGNQGFLEAELNDSINYPNTYRMRGADRDRVVRGIQEELAGEPYFRDEDQLRLSGRRSDVLDKKTFPVTERLSETDYTTPSVVGSYDTFQDPETLGPATVPENFLDAPFEFLPLFSGPLDFNFSPEPRREPEVFNTRADGGEIFGNQNMSTFDKLKAIADGIADNK
tara:strand:- start:44 stop:1708 length:1665 start_codon:yes stop_codon:yes gene_type:complete